MIDHQNWTTRYGGGQDQTIDELLLPGYEKDQARESVMADRCAATGFRNHHLLDVQKWYTPKKPTWHFKIPMFNRKYIIQLVDFPLSCYLFFLAGGVVVNEQQSHRNVNKKDQEIDFCKDEIAGVLHVT